MLSVLSRTGRRAVAGVAVGSAALAMSCAISPRQEVELGRDYAAQINRELPIIQDAAVNRYLNVLGQRIAAGGDRNLNYTFYVVNTDAVNAFAVPGGFIYVNRGLIERTDNLAELAGVLAHEIAHVEERHGVEQLERAQRANVGLSLAYILIGRAPTGVERAAIQVGGAAVFARYSRGAEREADATAIPLLVRAGIDPNGLVTFFMELMEARQRQPNLLEQWFSTHPTTEERIAEAREMIRQLPASQVRGLTVDTPQFREFRERVRRQPPPPARFRAQR